MCVHSVPSTHAHTQAKRPRSLFHPSLSDENPKDSMSIVISLKATRSAGPATRRSTDTPSLCTRLLIPYINTHRQASGIRQRMEVLETRQAPQESIHFMHFSDMLDFSGQTVLPNCGGWDSECQGTVRYHQPYRRAPVGVSLDTSDNGSQSPRGSTS